MNHAGSNKIHWSFWLIGILAFFWNGLGGVNYLMQMNPEALATYPESHRLIIDSRPAWATAGFAIAVFGGALGALLMLLRRSAAWYIFIASLAGAIAATVHTVRVVAGSSAFNPFEVFMMSVMPVIVALLLVWYAGNCRRKGWLV